MLNHVESPGPAGSGSGGPGPGGSNPSGGLDAAAPPHRKCCKSALLQCVHPRFGGRCCAGRNVGGANAKWTKRPQKIGDVSSIS
jgi:hypothetical protein